MELWVEYMLHFRPQDADWTMVTPYFVQLLLQDSIPVWYANGQKYKIQWGDVEHVSLVLFFFIGIFFRCFDNKPYFFLSGLYAYQCNAKTLVCRTLSYQDRCHNVL